MERLTPEYDDGVKVRADFEQSGVPIYKHSPITGRVELVYDKANQVRL
jgi:hypothetical protein